MHFAMTLNLKDDPALMRQYKEYHKNVWPEVKASLKAVGITEMHIFVKGRRMFMYCVARDGFVPARDFARYQRDVKTREWDALMRNFQEPAPEAAPGEWWSQMEELFDLERR